MAAATFSDMPQELLNEFVGYLFTPPNHSDLKASALVCRSLRSPSQRLIFHHTYITKTKRIFQLIKLMQENHLIASYLDIVYVSSRQFIPIYGIDTPLASLFLLVRNLSPHKYLAVMVSPQTPDAEEHHSWPINHISQELRFYSLSVVNRLLLVKLADFPAVALFNFRRLIHIHFDRMTVQPDFPIIFSPQRMSPVSPFFFRDMICLEIHNIANFPAVLISNCHALTRLTICNASLSDYGAAATHSRPQLKQLFVYKYNFETITTLIESAVDLSYLQELEASTKSYSEYTDNTPEEDEEITQCQRYLLSESKHSLTSLKISCVINNYEEVVTAIPCSLSEISNLQILTLDFNCWDETAQRYAPLYLLKILETVDTETTQIEVFQMSFYIKLEAMLTDSDGSIHLNINDLPLAFSSDVWEDIQSILSELAHSTSRTELEMKVTYLEPFPSDSFKYDNDPSETVIEIMRRWAQDTFLQDESMRSGAEFPGAEFTLLMGFIHAY